MLRGTIMEIFSSVWPLLILVSVIVISLRLAYIIKYKPKIIFYKEMIYFGFIIYVLCLFYVVTFQDVSWSTSNYVPFREMFRYSFGSRLFFKNVVGNMLMFMPFGFFVAYILKLKKTWVLVLISLIVSLTIESIQSVIGRVFDVDDIILNVIGAVGGFLIFKIVYFLKLKSPSFLKKDIIYNILMVIIIALMLVYMLGIMGDVKL